MASGFVCNSKISPFVTFSRCLWPWGLPPYSAHSFGNFMGLSDVDRRKVLCLFSLAAESSQRRSYRSHQSHSSAGLFLRKGSRRINSPGKVRFVLILHRVVWHILFHFWTIYCAHNSFRGLRNSHREGSAQKEWRFFDECLVGSAKLPAKIRKPFALSFERVSRDAWMTARVEFTLATSFPILRAG